MRCQNIFPTTAFLILRFLYKVLKASEVASTIKGCYRRVFYLYFYILLFNIVRHIFSHKCVGISWRYYILQCSFNLYALPLNNLLGLSFGSSQHRSLPRLIFQFIDDLVFYDATHRHDGHYVFRQKLLTL